MRQIRVAQLLEIGVRKGKNRLDLIDGEIVDRRDVAELLHQSWAYKEVGPGSKAFPVWAPQNLYILWRIGEDFGAQRKTQCRKAARQVLQILRNHQRRGKELLRLPRRHVHGFPGL